MGLALKPSKTRITHTLEVAEGTPGFDFLGFQIRQYPVGKTKSGKDCRGRLHGFKTRITPSPTAIQRHIEALRKTIDSQRHAEQEALIKALNPQIIGWSAYYAHVVSARVFQRLDHTVYAMLWGWAVSRHCLHQCGFKPIVSHRLSASISTLGLHASETSFCRCVAWLLVEKIGR